MRNGFKVALFSLFILFVQGNESHAARIGTRPTYYSMAISAPLRVTAGVYFNVKLEANYRLDMRCRDISLHSVGFGKNFSLKSGKALRKVAFTQTGQQALSFECTPYKNSLDIWSAGKYIYVSN